MCGRVTDASLVVGPAAWWHGWARDDFDALAGAVVAGHVIECGPQATGGNYSLLEEIRDRRYPGFPIAEVAADGIASSPSTRAPAALVSPGTVTAQLLYEIAAAGLPQPRRHRPLRHHRGSARTAPTGCGSPAPPAPPPPSDVKVAINYLGGYRNTMTLVLTGLDIEAEGRAGRAGAVRDPRRARVSSPRSTCG